MTFPHLQLLKMFAPSTAIRATLSRTLLVGAQHLLETTGSLLEYLLYMGLPAQHMFLLGKAYSSNSSVVDALKQRGVRVDAGTLPDRPGEFQQTFLKDVDRLWADALVTLRQGDCSDVVILDDGGRCISSLPIEAHRLARVAAVEQTTSGLAHIHSPDFRVIEVATSAAKRVLEAPMVSRAVLRRLPEIDAGTRCGVIGVGSIGTSVLAHLLRKQLHTYALDRDPDRARVLPQAEPTQSLQDLMSRAELVFGCSGADLFAEEPVGAYRVGLTTLASCSSEDREFRSLLVRAGRDGSLQEWTALGTAAIRRGPSELRVLRGGFPLNFDGSVESAPAAEIQLTRSLLVGGVLQALLCGRADEGGLRMLDPFFQTVVAKAWLASQPARREDFTEEIIDGLGSELWMREHSGGEIEEATAFKATLDVVKRS